MLGGGHGDVGARVLGTAQSPMCHPGQNCPRAIASSKGTVTMEGEQGLQGQRENVPLSSQKGREMRNKAGSSSVSNVQHKICFSCSPRVLLALLGSPQKRDPDANSALPNPGPFCQAVCQGNQPVTGGFWCSETPPRPPEWHPHLSPIAPELTFPPLAFTGLSPALVRLRRVQVGGGIPGCEAGNPSPARPAFFRSTFAQFSGEASC